jgi:hypothetical protein
MNKFTTEQLQAALLGLHPKNDADSVEAYRMTFDEVARRMGGAAFDTWCDSVGI